MFFLNCNLHLACVWNCVGIILQLTAGWKSVDYFSALAQVGSLALYYETTQTTDARKMEFNNTLPTRKSTNTWRASSRSDTTSFLLPSVAWRRPSLQRMALLGFSRACGLRGGGRQWRWSWAVAAADCRTLRSLLGLRKRGLDTKGDCFRECMSIIQAMPCTYLVMNESSRAWTGAEQAGGQE